MSEDYDDMAKSKFWLFRVLCDGTLAHVCYGNYEYLYPLKERAVHEMRPTRSEGERVAPGIQFIASKLTQSSINLLLHQLQMSGNTLRLCYKQLGFPKHPESPSDSSHWTQSLHWD